MNVCVAGVGYVGLITGVCLAYLDNNVYCVDIDPEKIQNLKNGIPPIYEPGLKELLEICTKKGTIKFSTDIEEGVINSDVIFIAVGTPSLPSGEPNLEYVRSVSFNIGKYIDCNKSRIVINKSTVPIGSGNWVEMLINEGVKSNKNICNNTTNKHPKFWVVSNPEFLREGCAIHDTLYPDRIVIGSDNDEALAILTKLYNPILQQNFIRPVKEKINPPNITAVPLVTTDITSAEMIKYASNAFLATKISFINEIANICEKVGADVQQVAQGIGLDSRIGNKFLNAGIGWGGSCFPKDLSAIISIAKEYDYDTELLKATINVNMQQRHNIIKKLQQALKIIKGRTIGILGLSFKPNTDDLRDAPSIYIITQLLKMGACIKAYDPIAMTKCQKTYSELNVTYENNILDLAKDCDAIIIVTEWDEFIYMDLNKIKEIMSIPIIIDSRNILDTKAAEKAGIILHQVGKSSQVKSLLNSKVG